MDAYYSEKNASIILIIQNTPITLITQNTQNTQNTPITPITQITPSGRAQDPPLQPHRLDSQLPENCKL